MREEFSKKFFNFPSKKEGAKHWWVQRLTGVALVFLGVWFLGSLFATLPSCHGQAYYWISQPLNLTLFSLLIGFLLWHAYLGLEVIIDDYVHMAFWHSAAMGTLKFIVFLSSGAFLVALYRFVF